MESEKTVAVTIKMRPDEAESLAGFAAEVDGPDAQDWLVRSACAQLGLFGWDHPLRFDDDEDE